MLGYSKLSLNASGIRGDFTLDLGLVFSLANLAPRPGLDLVRRSVNAIDVYVVSFTGSFYATCKSLDTPRTPGTLAVIVSAV
jgi:hypothetical protein